MNQYEDDERAQRYGWGAPHPLSFAALAADQLIYGREVCLCGWSASERTGNAATFDLYASDTDGQGELVASVNLAANGMSTQWLGDAGVVCRGGLFCDRLSGTFNLIVWVRDPLA